MSSTPIPTPLDPRGGRTAPLRVHFLRALVAAGVMWAGTFEVLAQSAGDEWKGFRDGLPSEASTSFTPAFTDPELFNVGYGPLRFRSQSVFQSLRLGALPDPPTYLPRGHWEARETFEWSRMWAQTPDYFLDFDTWSSGHSVAYGAGDWTQVELGVVQTGWSRGKLDGFVRGFHKAFGIDQGGRDQAQKGEFAFQVRDRRRGTTVVVDDHDEQAVTEQLVVSVHTILTPGTEELPAVAWSLTAKANLRDTEQIDGDGLDFATSVSFSKQVGDFHAYATLAIAWYGRETFYGIDLKPFTVSVVCALEWRASDGFSLILQHQWTQGAVRDLASFSEPSNEISLGAKVLVSDRLLIEVSVVENIVNFDNSPDFGLHTGVTVQF
jgi:hypothetical protein